MIRGIGWLAGIGLCLLGYAVRLGWKTRQLLQRMDRLERHDRERKEDIAALLEGMFAVLDGLQQQGCTGEVTRAHAALKQHVLQRY